MESYMQFLRELREDSDKTQQDIADVLQISQTMYARYERGANELPIRHLIALCKYYKVSSDAVLGLFSTRKRASNGH
ncbi:MAG: helix-turn-helix domain-containing protein [Oscillospiraceae bacterium]|nr:helix-turn-helix domain-containing protein [Oscillospiraceae bacterium]